MLCWFPVFLRDAARHPIEEESHRDFIASLNERMDAIEKVRNSVATTASFPTGRGITTRKLGGKRVEKVSELFIGSADCLPSLSVQR